MTSDHLLIIKLDDFIRKYYKNRLIRGIVGFFTVIPAFYIFLVILEYFFHFNQFLRTVLFFSFSGFSIFLFVRVVLVPLLQLYKIGKIITHDKAAQIVGQHFSDIQDKLLNTLQLIKQKGMVDPYSDLLTASIEQKTKAMKVFRFSVAIDFRKNLRYLRFAILPISLILFIIIIAPNIISEPTSRIVHFNHVFVVPPPFKIEFLNKSWTTLQQEDFELKIKVTGEEIPSEIYVKTKDFAVKMCKGQRFAFSHLFKSLQKNVYFKLVAGDYQSEEYEIIVNPKPIILNFDVFLKYPIYINKVDEKVENLGDFTIPEGTVMTWNFHTKDVSSLRLRFDSVDILLSNAINQKFSYSQKISKSLNYCISPINVNVSIPDSLTYRISVIPDGYPSVFINESADSTIISSIFFKGTIKDDYGFSKLTFNYGLFSKEDSIVSPYKAESVMIDNSINNQVFYFSADLTKLMVINGQHMNYYFEVWDNDGIHGPKSARSEMKTISTPTIDEISILTSENEQSINKFLEKSISTSKGMTKTMENLSKQLIDKNTLSWQEKMKIEDLIKANRDIEDKVQQIRKKNENNILNEEKFLKTSERIIEKQKQLTDLMEQLLSEEMKKMVKEMKDLLNQIDKTKLGNMLEKMKLLNEDLENQLDRNLALMKQIEFERILEELVKDIRSNADNLESLAKETDNQRKDKEVLLQNQESIKKIADTLAKKATSLEKQGKELETPTDIGNNKNLEDSIGRNLAESKQKLGEDRKKEAAEAQRKAAKQMKEMAQQMEDSQEESEDDQLGEDASNIRMIVENLLRLSFEQEDLIANTRVVTNTDPKYNEIILKQKELSEKLVAVEDSLYAIAKRQIMIKPIVSKEISAVNQNIELSLEAMKIHNINMAVAKQQYAMTSLNNLAILLNESLEQMNEQKSMNMKTKGGKKSCQKPTTKGGKMSAKDMKDLQQKIGKQLEKLKSGIEEAKKQGLGKMQDKSGMNKEIAKLAAQQEALRNQLQSYQDQMSTKNAQNQSNLNEVSKEMEQMERDLINKNITRETFLRQQNIVTRLLESENAEQTRDQEEKREATEAKNQKIGNPGQNFQYNKMKKTSLDNIQLVLPVLNSFYKRKVNSYSVKIGQ